MTEVIISKLAEKQLRKAPLEIRHAFRKWYEMVSWGGIDESRFVSGYRDKVLDGKRKGQRSVRLNRAWRLFYREDRNGMIEITVLEINKHDY
jgi:proteic killer suppression protein